jgi:hypothetical protein
MIDVAQVLRDFPPCEKFCSVATLHAWVEALRTDASDLRAVNTTAIENGRSEGAALRTAEADGTNASCRTDVAAPCTVEIAGTSAKGIPIYHLRFGSGSTKALIVGGPHAPEQIGSATILGLLNLLKERHSALFAADVEWHIVPCLDPDGAILNEGWTQKSFTLENYLRNHYEQPSADQVDRSFPIRYKKLHFDKPTPEAKVLQKLLDQIRPDYFYTLHNFSPAGATWFAISRDIDARYYRELHQLLERYRIPMRRRTPTSKFTAQFADGVCEWPTLRNIYDQLEKTMPFPEVTLQGTGAGSSSYLAQIKQGALSFCTELVHLRHPSATSQESTPENLRQIRLRIDADNKFLAALILEEWKTVAADLEVSSPFYRKLSKQLIEARETLHEGIPQWNLVRTRDILFNPADGKIATRSELFSAWMADRFKFLCNAYGFVRLLEESRQTSAVLECIARMERVFAHAIADLGQQVDFEAFDVIDPRTLAQVQLGSGLIALNSVLEERERRRATS